MNELWKSSSNTERAFKRSWHSFGISILLLVGIMAFALLVPPSAEAALSLVRIETLLMSGLRTADDPSDPIGPWWLRLVMADLTTLGGRTVITLITLVAVGYLIAIKRVTTAALLAATIVGGAIANMLLKEAFSRTRPDVVTHLVEAHSSSFPSAHAMNSAVTYLTLGALLAYGETRRPLRAYFLSVGIALTALVGFSRVYLGVHWPSDVVAGWCVGACWVALCLLTARAIQRGRYSLSPIQAVGRER